LLLVLLVADGVHAGLRFRGNFTSAACALNAAADRIDDFEVGEATSHLERARDEAVVARRLLDRPGPWIAGRLPWIGRNIRAVTALTRAAEASADAGLAGVRASDELGLSGSGSLAQVYDGRVRFETLAAGARFVTQAADRLRAARAAIEDAPRGLVGPIKAGLAAAARIVREAVRDAETAEAALAAVPGLLGAEGERRYFLAFQTPSEARGGGGLIGVYGILVANEGKLRLEDIAPIREIVPKLKRAVEGPEWFAELYGALDGLRGWREANQSPTFPTTSAVLLRMYEASTGDTLDGVIAMDPLVVADLLEGTGPIEARGYPVEITHANAADILLKDIYLDFAKREDEQNRFLKDLVDKLWSKLGTGDIDGVALAEAIGRSVATGHLKMYSAEPSEEDALRRMRVAGDPVTYGPHVQMIFHNNFAANKIDYFLERTQDTNIVIAPDGSAKVVVTMVLENHAPRGQRTVLKKSDVNELPSGLNQMSLHFMVPRGANIETLYVGDIEETFFDGTEAGVFPVAWIPLQVKVQQKVTASIAYSVADIVRFEGGRGRLDLTLLPQALVRPDRFNVKVVAPPGYRIGGAGSGAAYSEDPMEVEGRLATPKEIKAVLLAPGVEPERGSRLRSVCASGDASSSAAARS